MPKLTFMTHDGQRYDIEASIGASVMEMAVAQSVPGIAADCGGACACATCHVYVHPDWVERVGKPEAMEEDMLDFVLDPKPESRLACQIRITAPLDGLLLTLPEKQV
jgi:2Fe-2S ferredoxin